MCGTFRTGALFVATKESLKATTMSPLLTEESMTASWPVAVKVHVHVHVHFCIHT